MKTIMVVSCLFVLLGAMVGMSSAQQASIGTDAVATPERFKKLVDTWVVEGARPIVVDIASISEDGTVTVRKYSYAGREFPMAGTATADGDKLTLRLAGGQSGGIQWNFTFHELHGGMLQGTGKAGNRPVENKFYRATK